MTRRNDAVLCEHKCKKKNKTIGNVPYVEFAGTHSRKHSFYLLVSDNTETNVTFIFIE